MLQYGMRYLLGYRIFYTTTFIIELKKSYEIFK